ncbi:MAG: cellulase family glycosylhydrolase [Promethearchaeota archaeon]
MVLDVQGHWFIDQKGRKVLLRGVNLGGSSKIPVKPNGATHVKTNFRDHREVSFIGRPFPLREAHEHFKRIKHWGFNCIRFLITWEAVEHFGSGIHDKEYLDYLEEILKIANEYKFYIFIDPHQDVWSRMTGGDGAPGWLFEKVGLDFTKFDASEAAFVMQYRYDPSNPKAYPQMYWDNNNVRFANATMWTLFFGGKDFAPSCTINGQNIQEYMQSHFFNSVKQIALRVKDIPAIIGFETLNEPKQGWIERWVDGRDKENYAELLGHVITPIDAMALAAGIPREVGYQEIKGLGIKQTRKEILNKYKISCWLEGAEDIWRKEGVWDINDENQPIIIKNDHFCIINGKKVDFYKLYLSPFINSYAKMIHEIMPHAIIFFEGPELDAMKGIKRNFILSREQGPFVHAPHWYDTASTVTKRAWLRFNIDIMRNKLIIGKKNVQKMFNRQLKTIKSTAEQMLAGIPTLIGEFGLHYDLNKKKAYKKFKKIGNRAFKKNVEALNMFYNALDANLLHGTQWNYTSDNNNEWGDQWNLEDLSIFSRDQQTNPNDINSGGRAIEGFCRPHLIKCAGTPLKMEFILKKGIFIFEYEADSSLKTPTIIYIPSMQYPKGYKIEILNNSNNVKIEKKEHFLKIFSNDAGIIKIMIKRIK